MAVSHHQAMATENGTGKSSFTSGRLFPEMYERAGPALWRNLTWCSAERELLLMSKQNYFKGEEVHRER